MGKAPALSACLFCDQLPCVCNKVARAAPKPRATKQNPVVVAASAPEPEIVSEPAPRASARRFDATAAMKATAATSPVRPAAIPPRPAPVSPVRAQRTAAVPFTPTITPDAPQAILGQAVQGAGIMQHAVHLVRVTLGGKVIDNDSD